MCQYWYLHSTLGPQPYLRLYVNVEEILARAARYIENRQPEITVYEAGVPLIKSRIEAALKMRDAGYPVGFMIAPVFLYQGWEKDYQNLLEIIAQQWNASLPSWAKKNQPIPTFEIIAHRFTPPAKKNILSIFPGTTLPLDEKKVQIRPVRLRKVFISPREYKKIERHFQMVISRLFPGEVIEYTV